MIRLADRLERVARVLHQADFAVDRLEVPGIGPSLLAETPHALVLCVPGEWEMLAESVEEAQATLTNLAARHPSPRSWDLYVVVSIDRFGDEAQEILRERIEHDTRYARKFVLAGRPGDDSAVERALRPLLPLRASASVHLTDPLQALRTELLRGGADRDVVDIALRSFSERGEVEVV